MSSHEKQARENFIRKNTVKERLGGISDSSLYRYWKVYGLLPPPKKLQGINVWPESAVEKLYASVMAS